MSVDELMFYRSVSDKHVATAVFSQDASVTHDISEKAKQQYGLLLDVIGLCAIYY